MSVSPANNENIDAWQKELDTGLDAIEALEYAQKLARTLSGATEAVRDIDDALFSLSNVVSRGAALRVARLKRDIVADEA